jgi:hypothetical protein
MAGIIQGGSATVQFDVFPSQNGDRMEGNVASVESIKLDEYVVKVDDTLTAGDAVATCTRAAKVLTADKIAVSGNMSRALDIVTCATPGSAKVIKLGDSLEINSGAAGVVIELIDNTNVRVNASGTIGAAAGTYQRALFAKVFPGAALVLATGTTAATVASKTSDFVVNTVEDGTVTTGLLTSYKNVDSIARYKEDGSHGAIYGIAMDAFTFNTAYGTATPVQMSVKVFGQFDKDKTTTIDHATAGTVPQSVHASVYGRLFHTSTTRIF